MAATTEKPKNKFKTFISNLGKALSESDLDIKVNNSQFKKDKKNNMSFLFTKDNVRTSVHISDSKFGIEQTKDKKDDATTVSN